MKLIVLAAVFSSAFVLVLSHLDAPSGLTPEEQAYIKKYDEANKLCNATFPATENPRTKIGLMVAKGDTIPRNLNSSEYCHLYCFLEQIGFFDADGKIQARKVFKYTLKNSPEVAPNSHTFLIQLYQIARSTNRMEDKCRKAFVAYYRYTEAIMIAYLGADLNVMTDARRRAMEAALKGEDLPKDFDEDIEKYFKNIEVLFGVLFDDVKQSSNSTSTTSSSVPVLANPAT